MEEYEEQEQEFWRKLAEMDMSRSTMLRRSFAAAAGLTVLSTPAVAEAARRVGAKTPPLKGKSISMKELVAQAKKEGHINTIALPPDWSNYGEVMSTFQKKYGLGLTNDNPDGSSAQENQAIVSLKGDSRAPDVVDVGPSFAVAGTAQGLYATLLPDAVRHDPARYEGHTRLLVRRLLGSHLDRLQPEPRAERAEDLERPAEAGVQGQGRDERLAALVELGGLRGHRGVDR